MCIVVAVEYADYFSRVVMSCSFLFFLCSAAYRFLFDGNRVNDTDTPESLEMVRCVLPAWVFVAMSGPSRSITRRLRFLLSVGILARQLKPSC